MTWPPAAGTGLKQCEDIGVGGKPPGRVQCTVRFHLHQERKQRSSLGKKGFTGSHQQTQKAWWQRFSYPRLESYIADLLQHIRQVRQFILQTVIVDFVMTCLPYAEAMSICHGPKPHTMKPSRNLKHGVKPSYLILASIRLLENA